MQPSVLTSNRTRRLALLALLFVLLVAARASVAEAASLRVLPETVQLTPSGSRFVSAVVRFDNDGTTTASELLLDINAGDNVIASWPEEFPPTSVAPGESWTSEVILARSDAGPLQPAVFFTVRYVDTPSPGSSPVAHAVVVSAPLTEFVGTTQAISSIATMTLQMSSRDLQETRPGSMLIDIANTSAGGLTVLALDIELTDRIDVKPGDFSFNGTHYTLIQNPTGEFVIRQAGVITHFGDRLNLPEIPSQQSITIPLTLTPRDDCRQGSTFVTVTAEVAWKVNWQPQTGFLTSSNDITVSVWGESDVLKVFELSSFWILPGFLGVVVAFSSFSLFWYMFKGGKTGKREWKKVPDLVKHAWFWVVSISLSAVFAFYAYPFITAVFGERRSYVDGYGLRDVFYVWSISIVLGALVGFVFYFRLRKKTDEKKTPEVKKLEVYLHEMVECPPPPKSAAEAGYLSELEMGRPTMRPWSARSGRTGRQIRTLFSNKKPRHMRGFL
jgi:hypothetical protein